MRGQNTSSTNISVSWEAVQAELRNGIITGYNITYKSQTENDNGFVEASPNDRQANLTGLKEFVDYNISVVAFTAKGDGPPSVIVVRTDQDSKSCQFYTLPHSDKLSPASASPRFILTCPKFFWMSRIEYNSSLI